MQPEMLKKSLEMLIPDRDSKFNIAMLHAVVVGVTAFRSNEFNEQDVASGYLKPEFNYIALGHYHEFIKVDENAYYSGSTERINFLEANHVKKGFIELNFDDAVSVKHDLIKAEDNGFEVFYPQPIFHEIPTRPMINLKSIDCSMIQRHQIGPEIIERIASIDPLDRILRLKIKNLPMEVYKSLDFNQFRKLTANALHFELQYEVTRDNSVVQAPDIKFEVLGNEFKSFLSNLAVEGLDKERLTVLGVDYLTRAGADISGTDSIENTEE